MRKKSEEGPGWMFTTTHDYALPRRRLMTEGGMQEEGSPLKEAKAAMDREELLHVKRLAYL